MDLSDAMEFGEVGYSSRMAITESGDGLDEALKEWRSLGHLPGTISYLVSS